jgi:curli production assembly/transport component CsgG
MIKSVKAVICAASIFGLAGCEIAVPAADAVFIEQAEEMRRTQTGLTLETLPAPQRAIDVGVYAFPDLTGQNEPNENYAELSRAVTQGGADILVDVLASAGQGRWFNVIERTRVDSLLRERAIIEQTQAAY